MIYKTETEQRGIKQYWKESGFADEIVEQFFDFYQNRYGNPFYEPLSLVDRRLLTASHFFAHMLDADLPTKGFKSRLDMALAILNGSRNDLLMR